MTLPLHVGSKPVATVFDLLGSAENDLTYALGWALAKAAGFARILMIDAFGQDVGEVVAVNLQRFGPDGGFTDIEVVATGGHLIVEAKRGWQVPQLVQLERYRNRPAGVPAVLLSLSAASRDWALRQGRLPRALGDVRVDHRSWGDLARLADTSANRATGTSKQLLRDLALYTKGVSRIRDVSSNWAYCVVLAQARMHGSTATWMDVPLVHRRYTHPYDKHWPTTPPNYLAFRWRGKVRQFNHVENTLVVDDLSEALGQLFLRAPSPVRTPCMSSGLRSSYRGLSQTGVSIRLPESGS